MPIIGKPTIGPVTENKGKAWTWRQKAGVALLVVVALYLLCLLIFFFSWPYRLERPAAEVSENTSGCKFSIAQVSGLQTRRIAPLIDAEDVAYPLDVSVFIHDCAGLSDGRPYAARLFSAGSGNVIAEGLACGGARESDNDCRLEPPLIASRSASHRFVIQIVRTRGETPRKVDLEITTPHRWRSVVIDGIMSV